MNADQWPRVKDIFHAAIERAPGNRAAFVMDACGGDAALRAEVERLIAAHDRAGSFIDQSPVAGAQPRQTSLSGRVIGRYEVGRLLGAGGMGEVYAARDVELGRQVALKIATGFDADAQTRLRREAQHASQLNHPHICTIHEVGAADGQSYIVMEYVDGQRLCDIIPPTGLPVETVLRYGIQIADALAHAHRNGVTHRDLKTANIIITSEGRAKVLDFGLARRNVPQTEKSLTAEGSVSGTLAYMAPELLRGKQADACSDIWALGVVLYEMAAGSRPFAGATGFEQSGAILHEPPAPLPGRIPVSLQQVIRRCLAKDPRERYKQANEIRSALETGQVGVVPASVPAITVPRVPLMSRLLKSCRSRRVAWIGGVSLAIIVLTNLPTSTARRNARGYALLEAGHPEDAIREFEKNVKAAPREANSYDSLGEAYLVMGSPDKALEHYERALTIDPTYSASRTGRAWAWGMLGRFDQAIADDPPDSYVKALLLSRVGRYEETEEVLTGKGRNASALLLASMLATERGEYADALKNVQSAEAVIADLGEESRRVYSVLAGLLGGSAEARSGELKAAQARLAAQAKRYKATDPTEKWWHQTLAGEIALAGDDPQAALDAYAAGEPSRKMWANLRDTSMVIFANSLSVRDVPARAQAARGDLARAIQTYRLLLTAGPDQKWAAVYEPRYVLEIARLLNRAGDNQAAKQEYQRFLDFWKNADPGLPEVAEARRMVNSR
jgi:tetratricopeptide (TPR) repeat protein/predicted Ser/Thr protein kinase